MRKLNENFLIFHFQKRIVSAEIFAIRENTVFEKILKKMHDCKLLIWNWAYGHFKLSIDIQVPMYNFEH
jgi:hypothetical protein